MSRNYAILIDRQRGFLDIADLPKDIAQAARIAANRTAESARTRSARQVRNELNVPASYVSPSQNRLSVSKKATNSDLESVVSARTRPTSLARFVTSPPRKGQQGARVEVKPGFARFIRNAVFVRLRVGADTDSNSHNLGLAVRMRNGRRPQAAYKPVQLGAGLWLLYGPSVAQALLSVTGAGIWEDLTPQIQDDFEREFLRNMRRTDANR